MIFVSEETERETVLVDTLRTPNFHLHGNSDDDQADTIPESKLFRAVVRVGWPRTRGSDQSERCTKETSTSRRFYPKGGGVQGAQENPSKS